MRFHGHARGADASVPGHNGIVGGLGAGDGLGFFDYGALHEDEPAFGEDRGHGCCFCLGARGGESEGRGAEFVVEDVARELGVAVTGLDDAGESELGGEYDVDLADDEPDAAPHFGVVGGDADELGGVAVVAH